MILATCFGLCIKSSSGCYYEMCFDIQFVMFVTIVGRGGGHAVAQLVEALRYKP
jgi:hypothetical protein